MDNNNTIPQLDFSIASKLQYIEFSPNKIALFDSIKELNLGYHPNYVRPAVLVICTAGFCVVEVDLKNYEIRPGCVLIVVPNQIIQLKEISQDFTPLCLAVSKEIIDGITYKVENLTQFILIAKENSMLQLNDVDFLQLIRSYEFIKSKIKINDESSYHRQILAHQLISIFYECYGFLQREKSIISESSSRKDTLFNRFINLVIDHHRKEHSPSYYADKLCITPKYLSVITEYISGKSVKKWIDEYIILDAKVLLKTSDKTIQQIADELNFPTASFFGKYFKRILKISPKEYRENKIDIA